MAATTNTASIGNPKMDKEMLRALAALRVAERASKEAKTGPRRVFLPHAECLMLSFTCDEVASGALAQAHASGEMGLPRGVEAVVSLVSF